MRYPRGAERGNKRQATLHRFTERTRLFLAPLYRAELGVAERLTTLLRAAPPWERIDPDIAIPWVEEKTKLVLSPSARGDCRAAESAGHGGTDGAFGATAHPAGGTLGGNALTVRGAAPKIAARCWRWGARFLVGTW